MSNYPPGWTQDVAGNWVQIPGPSLAAQTAQFLSDRAAETSSQISASAGVAVSPLLIQQAGSAIVAGLSGDVFGCLTNGLPVLFGGLGLLKVMLTPDKPVKGPTDDQIKTAIAAMSRDDLIGLLADPDKVSNTAAVVQPAATPIASVQPAG